jgi:hypothetical protein
MPEEYGNSRRRLFTRTVKRILGDQSKGTRTKTGNYRPFHIEDAEPTRVLVELIDFEEELNRISPKKCTHCKFAAVRGTQLELTECRNPRSPAHGRVSLISEGFGCLFHVPHVCGIIPGIKDPVAKQGDDHGISSDGDGTEQPDG